MVLKHVALLHPKYAFGRACIDVAHIPRYISLLANRNVMTYRNLVRLTLADYWNASGASLSWSVTEVSWKRFHSPTADYLVMADHDQGVTYGYDEDSTTMSRRTPRGTRKYPSRSRIS